MKGRKILYFAGFLGSSASLRKFHGVIHVTSDSCTLITVVSVSLPGYTWPAMQQQKPTCLENLAALRPLASSGTLKSA